MQIEELELSEVEEEKEEEEEDDDEALLTVAWDMLNECADHMTVACKQLRLQRTQGGKRVADDLANMVVDVNMLLEKMLEESL